MLLFKSKFCSKFVCRCYPITLIANFPSIKILSHCFFGYSASSNLFSMIRRILYCSFFILLQFPQYSIITYYCFYTICFKRFSAYINHICIVVPQKFQNFLFLLPSHSILLTQYLLKQICHK